MALFQFRQFFRSRRFLRELKRYARQVIAARNVEPQVEMAECTVLDIDVEFLEICKVEDLARLAAIMILQSYQDQADSLDMRYNEARIVYITGYNEFELVPPPAPVIVDLVRLLASAARTDYHRIGSIRIPLPTGCLSLTAELVTEPKAALRISGFPKFTL